jgi:hypothetical protein
VASRKRDRRAVFSRKRNADIGNDSKIWGQLIYYPNVWRATPPLSRGRKGSCVASSDADCWPGGGVVSGNSGT